MKKSILLPLLLGLLVAGCSRTATDTKKLSSNSQTDPNKAIYDDQTAAARKDAASQAQASATTNPAPTTGSETKIDAAKTTTDSSASVAKSDTPVPTGDTPAVAKSDTPAPAGDTPAPAAAAAKSDATPTASTDVAKTEVASDKNATNNNATAKSDISARIAEWKLTPDDIRSEQEAGKIVRSKTVGAGEPTGPMDDVLVDQVKGKLQSDSATGQLKFDVTADKGVVTLKGSAHTLEQVGNAIALALDTPGVTQTVSEIKLETKQQP
jgi:hypothetical protein